MEVLRQLPVLALAGVVTAAGAVHAQDGEIGGKITFYTHFTNFVDDGKWAEWSSAFEEKYPGTEVEVVGVSNYAKEMPTRIASGDYGDVLNVLGNIPTSDYPEYYAPISDLDLAKTNSFVDRYSFDGEVYGYIYGVNAEGVVYNKRAFEQAGITEPPRTRTELFAACEKLTDAGLTPMLLNMGAGWPMQQWDKAALMFAGDGDYYESMLTEPAPYAADQPYGKSVRFVKELFEAGCAERDHTANNWAESQMLLGAGEAGMWFMANWSVPQVITAAEALGIENAGDDLGMFPLPTDDSREPSIVLNPDWALGVSAKSDNKATAKAFIEFILTETDVAEAAGFIPADPSREITMPQLRELFDAHPVEIRAGTPSSEFTQAMADARLDFMNGTYIRDLVLASDFDAAVAAVNDRWAKAIGQ